MRSRYTLKDLRDLNRLSLEEVSNKTKITVDRLKFIESDSSEIEASEMYLLSQLYKLSMNYIFFGKQADFDKKLSEYLGGQT
ncbi:helix-turn-helix domain-containing protein [Lactococcus lactis]|uniref:helix-turn-helix domain-containing protein n=1 Tax=Lactococcus lactis TaxID=1358 RepID=UPI003A805C8E